LYCLLFNYYRYPTAGLLPDGRVLVTGAFTDYSTDVCLGEECLNPQLNVFDPSKLDSRRQGGSAGAAAGSGGGGGAANPWTVWLDKGHADHDLDPGIREYTRIFPFFPPVAHPETGRPYDLLAMGKAGRVVLINSNDSTPMEHRLYKPSGGRRPGKCIYAPTDGDVEAWGSDQSTAVPLFTSRGAELMVMGGCTSDGDTMQSTDLCVSWFLRWLRWFDAHSQPAHTCLFVYCTLLYRYNIANDSWTRYVSSFLSWVS
jgi:hypothetical protein